MFLNYKNGHTRLTAASDTVYQLLVHGRWFSPASSTTKTGRHDIAEILLKVALNIRGLIILSEHLILSDWKFALFKYVLCILAHLAQRDR
jgi:hypothetical protein